MRLTGYLRADLTLTGLSGSDMGEIVHALSAHLADHLNEIDHRELREALLDREQQHTTALGRGVAIPHATVAGLEAPVVMVAVAEDEIQFGPPGTDPVRLFVVLVSPPNREHAHIELLARICRLVRGPRFMEDVLAAGDAAGILRAIEESDGEHV